MKVFLSWSGTRSKEVAEALKEWLPDVLHVVTPFVSSADIEKGRDFFRVLRAELAESNFGIVCLTKDNCRKPWVLFEGGALAKVLDNSSLCPYLIDMQPSELPDPLRLFEAAIADEQGTRDLVRALNSASDSVKLSEHQIGRTFDRWWPDLKPKLVSKAKPLGPSVEAGSYLFINVKTGLVLKAGGRPKNGELLETVACSGDDRETWTLHQVERRYYAIASAYTLQCLDVEGTSVNEKAKIHQWEFQNGDNQKWSLVVQKDGSYKVKAKHSGRYLAATDEGVKQMGDAESRNQRWWIAPVFGSGF
ncbi:MAG: RICIN domain-containing protein [Acidobacteriota bacterium]